MQSAHHQGFYRLHQIIGRDEITPEQAATNRQLGRRGRIPRPAIRPIIDVAPSTWWSWIKRGIAPAPFRIGGTALWRCEEVHALEQTRGHVAAEAVKNDRP